MSTLQLQVQMLKPAAGAEEIVSGKLERALVQTRRLAKLIDSLLEVSRITAGRMTLSREPTDLSAIARDTVQRLAGDAEAARCALVLDAGRPVVGNWDALRLEEVVTNLVHNAIRYAAGKPIDITVAGDRRRGRLTVRDRGPGIPPEKRERIFSRFERAGTQMQVQAGLGLGLYITRQIVEAHGGDVRVKSELGAGTEFVVDLPLELAERREKTR